MMMNMMNMMMKGHLYKAKPTAPALMEQDTYTGWGGITFKGPCEPFKYTMRCRITIQNGCHQTQNAKRSKKDR